MLGTPSAPPQSPRPLTDAVLVTLTLTGLCPVSFPQNPCESLRGHPAGMTYAANILPHHPARGTFEDFTC